MGTVNVKLVLRTDKMRKDGTAPIWVRITANRKSRYVATGVRIEPKDWNENKQEVRAGHELADAYNAKLKDRFHEAGREALNASSAKDIKVAMTGAGGSNHVFASVSDVPDGYDALAFPFYCYFTRVEILKEPIRVAEMNSSVGMRSQP